MPTTTERTAFRPFHETIADAIRQHCPGPSDGKVLYLLRLVRETKILTGHDAIIAAIDEYFDFPGAEKWASEVREVKEHLLAQKRAIEKEPDAKEWGINLDELQRETEKLLALLTDRQPGLTSWNQLMTENLQNLNRITFQALGG